MKPQNLIQKYHSYLPIKKKFIVSLGEGNTPLIRSCRLAEHLHLKAELYFKFEGSNPTGSFKDRGMTYAVSKAFEKGCRAVICASTGNTSASAAAYAARVGMSAIVIIPQGKIAYGKLAQAMSHGAQIVQVRGNFDEAFKVVVEIAQNHPVEIVNSVNPYRLQGQMTGAFEIIEELGEAPDYHFIPVGNAGNISSYWMGYRKYRDDGKSKVLPRMMGFQAWGAAPIVRGKIVENPETVATAIRIGNPANWHLAERARDESRGMIGKVTDREILIAQKLIAEKEGIFCEPASAASLAGLIKWLKRNRLGEGQRVVCVLTGHGLKDPDIVIENEKMPVVCAPDAIKVLTKISF